MKFQRTMPLVTAAVLMSPLGACGDDAAAKEVRDDLKNAAESVGAFTQQKLNEFRSSTESSLDDLSARYQELKSAAAAKGDELSAEAKARIDSLGNKLAELKKDASAWGEDVGAKSAETWATVKDRTGAALNSLGSGIEEAWTDLKGDG